MMTISWQCVLYSIVKSAVIQFVFHFFPKVYDFYVTMARSLSSGTYHTSKSAAHVVFHNLLDYIF